MAEKPYKFIDRRGQNAFVGSGNNQLVKAAVQTQDRRAVPFLDYDIHRNISRIGHRQLRSVGRFIFSNFGPVRGALLEQAEFSVSKWTPKFLGEDKKWGKKASAMLLEHDKIMDLRGWPHDGSTFRKNIIVGCRRDGDHAVLLTENSDGYPFVQVIPVHRLGSRTAEYTVEDTASPYDGLAIINGVIVNDYGTPVAYRIYGDYPYSAEYTDVPAASLILSFFPDWSDQVRGLTGIGLNGFDWSDISERREFELLAQKAGAALALIETNERGAPPPGASFISSPSTAPTSATPTGLITESYEGGMIKYFKSGSGGKIEGFKNERPSADQQAFEESIMRGAFAGMEWPIDFSLDPTKCGGAQMRVVIEKVVATIGKNQDLVSKVMRRVDGYRLSKFIKLGLLEPNPDWFRWAYQGPGNPTADAKYDSDIALQEIRAGISTRQKACAERGEDYEEVDDQKEREVDSTLTRSRRLADKHDVPIEEVITLMSMPTPNGMTVSEQVTADPAADPEAEPDDQPSTGPSGKTKRL